MHTEGWLAVGVTQLPVVQPPEPTGFEHSASRWGKVAGGTSSDPVVTGAQACVLLVLKVAFTPPDAGSDMEYGVQDVLLRTIDETTFPVLQLGEP